MRLPRKASAARSRRRGNGRREHPPSQEKT